SPASTVSPASAVPAWGSGPGPCSVSSSVEAGGGSAVPASTSTTSVLTSAPAVTPDPGFPGAIVWPQSSSVGQDRSPPPQAGCDGEHGAQPSVTSRPSHERMTTRAASATSRDDIGLSA